MKTYQCRHMTITHEAFAEKMALACVHDSPQKVKVMDTTSGALYELAFSVKSFRHDPLKWFFTLGEIGTGSSTGEMHVPHDPAQPIRITVQD